MDMPVRKVAVCGLYAQAFLYEVNEVGRKEFFELVKSWIQKLPLPYVIMVTAVGLGAFILTSSKGKEFLFGPEWECTYEPETEVVVFKTGTKLKSGKIKVRAQLEIKYDGKVYYILEVRGLYNVNEVSLSNNRLEEAGDGKEKQASMFCLTIENGQREKLDTFEERFQELLKERLRDAHQDGFIAEKFELNEKMVAEISYQSEKMNRSKTMYVTASGREISTVNRREVAMRSPNTFIDLDELNLEESFYTNEQIMDIMDDCMKEIGKGIG